MRTQVGIVGAGPAGLFLSLLLHRAGVDCVVLEARSRDYVESRVRAGVLEQGTVDLMDELGAGERLHREGMPDPRLDIRFNGGIIHIDLPVLTPGKLVTVYGQQEVVKDLIAVRLNRGGAILFEAEATHIDGLDGKQARIKVETSKTGKIEHWFDSFFEVVWPTALAYHFYVSDQLPNAFFYLALLIVAEALDGIGKLGVYVPAEKSLVGPGLFDRIVRLVGGRRNIYVWVLVACVVLAMPEKALIVMAFWEVATAAVDLLHSGWIRYVARRQSSTDLPLG